MVKKKAKKKVERKKVKKKIKTKTKINSKEIALMLENFAIIQKTLTNVTIAFKQLEKRFDKFLNLVEKAAKEKGIGIETKTKKSEIGKTKNNLSEKIDALIEQNKAIAEGMLLLEKFIKEKLGRTEKI